MNRAVFAAAALALSATPAAFAAAPAPSSDTFNVQVVYNTDALATSSGVAEVYTAINSQVRRACRANVTSTRAIEKLRQTEVCTADTLTNAVERIDNDDLTAYHERMTKG